MNPQLFYQWKDEIRKHFSNLNKWQALGLAIISYGIVKSRRSQASLISEEIPEFGKASTVERRIQRWIANPRILVSQGSVFWTQWVLESYTGAQIFLLVDETKISDRIGCMMVSLAIQNRAIPLIWRCYQANSSEGYPEEGQVKMIGDLLKKLTTVLPKDKSIILEADRGIGNSSNLMREISEIGIYFLFRINITAIFTSKEGVSRPLKNLARRGETWHGVGTLFTEHRAVEECTVHIFWDEEDCDEPWCLATNMQVLTGKEYKLRVWQEESFRDLKSAGWQWQSSLLRNPEIAERILLPMALAYAWCVSLGMFFENLDEDTRLPVDYIRKNPKYSVFRKGLRFFKRYLYLCPNKIPVQMGPFLAPSGPP